jgi:hypothetical protein
MSGLKIPLLQRLSREKRGEMIEVYLMQGLNAKRNFRRGDNQLVIVEVDKKLKELNATNDEILTALYNIKKYSSDQYSETLDKEIKEYEKVDSF